MPFDRAADDGIDSDQVPAAEFTDRWPSPSVYVAPSTTTVRLSVDATQVLPFSVPVMAGVALYVNSVFTVGAYVRTGRVKVQHDVSNEMPNSREMLPELPVLPTRMGMSDSGLSNRA